MRYVALLRGINVGGNNMIKMEKLREIVAELGFKNVKTYINSGNVAFDTVPADDKKLAEQIHEAIHSEFGFDISVMVRSVDEIKDLIAANPFEGQFDDDKNLHAFFLNEPLSPEQTALLLAHGSDAERFHLGDRYLLCLLTISILDSVLGKGFIDKKLKVATTARNWRTVKKLAEL